jgi:hypothetical protein
LVQDGEHAVAKHKRHKRIGALGTVLDVDGRVELEVFADEACDGTRVFAAGELERCARQEHAQALAPDIDDDGDPDEAQLAGIVDVDTRNPEYDGQ